MLICVTFLAALPAFDFATNAVARRIAAVDPAVCLSRFDDYPPSRGKLGFPRCLFEKPFPPNGRFWLKGVDFSCVSPWNDSYGTTRAGTLISRRHIVFVRHYPLTKGTRILFVDQEGEICPCTIGATKALERGDVMVGLLDYEVTPNIRPAKILPDDYARHIGDGKGLPIVTFNQREQVFLSQMEGVKPTFVNNVAPTMEAWKALGGNLIGGDSGNPAFLLIGDEAVLLYCLRGGGVGIGPSVFHHRREIQMAMDELCPGYKLETFDFFKMKK